MKIIAVGGKPGSGKTTLFQALIKKLNKQEPGDFVKAGLVVYHQWMLKGVVILGDYRKEGFGGTDKLSMSVQPQAVEFLKSLPKSTKVLFEGDRLFNMSFLTLCKEMGDLTCWVLKIGPNTQKKRFEERGSQQNETWLKGRNSKIQNIVDKFPHPITQHFHKTPEHTKELTSKLLEIID